MDILKKIVKIIAITAALIFLYRYGFAVTTRGRGVYTPDIGRITVPDQGTAEKKSINKASAEDIKEIKGFGDVFAKRIIDFRNELGELKGMEDLLEVDGIGTKRYEILRANFSI